MIRTIKITATLAGSNGSASGNATSTYPLSGKLVGIYIDVTTGSQPNTTDVTITAPGSDIYPATTLLTATNVSASAWYYPTIPLCDTSGAAVLFASGGTTLRGKIPVSDYIKVSGAQGNAGALPVYIAVECD